MSRNFPADRILYFPIGPWYYSSTAASGIGIPVTRDSHGPNRMKAFGDEN
jgi:hypothetical protein